MVNFNATQPVSDPAFFVGRRRILETLRDHTRSTVVIGEAKIGKTSLLLQLKRELESFGHTLIPRVPFYIDLCNPRFRQPADVYHTIADYLKGNLKRNDNFTIPDIGGNYYDPTWLLRFLGDLDANGLRLEVVLLVDNLDNPEAFLPERLTLYSGLRQLVDFSPNGLSLKLVASAKASFLSFEPATVSRLLSRLEVVNLDALSFEEAQRLISNSAIFDAAPQSQVLQEYLFDQCGGHPSLLQEVLAEVTSRVVDKRNLRTIIERSCNKLAENGGNFFQEYMDDLVYEEIICLMAMVLRLQDDEWHPPEKVAKKFLTAGLARENHKGHLEASCKIFFRWFRHNVIRILPGFGKVSPAKADRDFLAELLHNKLHQAASRAKNITERLLQDVIDTMLITVGIQAEREVTFYYREKAYRSDFVIPSLQVALEVKLAKSNRQIGPLIDELEADLNAYQANHRHTMVVIYNLTGSSRFLQYAKASQNPFVRYIVVQSRIGDEIGLGEHNGE